MPLPGDINTIIVTATYEDMSGKPATGTVIFEPVITGPFTDTTDGMFLLPDPVTVMLDQTGSIAPSLVCTDNTVLSPVNWAWQITEAVSSQPERVYAVQVPHTLGSTVKLASLGPVNPPTPYSTIYGILAQPNTWTGVNAFTAGVTVSPPVPLGSGGTGAATQQGAIDALTVPAGNTGKVLRSDGTHSTLAAIQAGDVPTLNQNTTGTAANVTGVVAIINGGTGAATRQAGIDALTGTQSSGQVLRSDGTHATLSAIQAADVPTLNQNTTGTAGNVTGIVAVVNGGTGSATKPFVDLTTNQTIAGIKTFTGEVVVPTPVNSGDAVTKAYADAIAQGLSVKPSVTEATTGALPANTYSAGVLTATSNAALTVDGITVTTNDRVLVKNEATAANNGIYVVTNPGSGAAAYVLTRAGDMNTGTQVPGGFVFVEQGTVNGQAGFTVAGVGPFTIGTTAINWTQFSGAGEITAGTGLTKTGNTLALATPVSVANGGSGSSTRTWAGLLTPPSVKTSNYTVAAGEFIAVDTTSTAVTITLPTTPADLTVAGVKLVKIGGANAVTINAGGAATFNGDLSTTKTLTLLDQGLLFQYNIALNVWYVTAGHLPLAQLDTRYVNLTATQTVSNKTLTDTAETVATNSTATGAVTVSLATGNVWQLTLTGNVTLTFAGATSGVSCALTLYVTQDSTGGRTVTWPGSVTWVDGAAPTIAAGTGVTSIVVFTTLNGGTTWYGVSVTGAPAIDTNAADIKPNATTASAGTSTLIPAADHVHTNSVIGGVTVTGTPTLNQVPIATSGTAATWQTPPGGVVLDTTSADIQPTGTTVAAGAVGKAADAGHVHTNTLIGSVAVSGTPTLNQVPVATSGTTATWQTTAGGVVLDTTAGDIAGLGVQAAGAVGKAADSGHVHPTSGTWTPGHHGLQAWTYDPVAATGQGTLTSGTLYLVGLEFGVPVNLTQLWWLIQTAAVTVTSAVTGLYNAAGTKITPGTDASAATRITSTSPSAVTITSTSSGTGLVWMALAVVATTMPALYRGASLGGSTSNLNLGVAVSRWGQYTVAAPYATLPSTITPASITPLSSTFWGGAA